jgi:hypothetical protein
MEKESKNWKIYLRILLLLVMLYAFYKLGFPFYFIVIFGIILLPLIVLRGTIYKKLDNFLCRKLPFLLKLNPIIKKIIIIIVFILVYMAVKGIIFYILSLFGIDVQKMISEGLNQSAG